ncbi:Na+/H+ antiporter [Entomophthora muscae]|uniref:Na+/H+ antiporter n=1 Tax=Entomophthora muscae TaxID=34485 RepID=A0ACC2TWF0_9FUNG|nr:Na+/H+ antiporter [Entomophthora muscae]
MVALEEFETYTEEYKVVPYIFPIVSFMVICSIIVHGITIPIFHIGKHIRARSFAACQFSSSAVARLSSAHNSQVNQKEMPSQLFEERLNPASDNTGASNNPDYTVIPLVS